MSEFSCTAFCNAENIPLATDFTKDVLFFVLLKKLYRFEVQMNEAFLTFCSLSHTR